MPCGTGNRRRRGARQEQAVRPLPYRRQPPPDACAKGTAASSTSRRTGMRSSAVAQGARRSSGFMIQGKVTLKYTNMLPPTKKSTRSRHSSISVSLSRAAGHRETPCLSARRLQSARPRAQLRIDRQPRRGAKKQASCQAIRQRLTERLEPRVAPPNGWFAKQSRGEPTLRAKTASPRDGTAALAREALGASPRPSGKRLARTVRAPVTGLAVRASETKP